MNWLKFRRQHSVWRYILDFYCPKYKLAIELDWEIHTNREEYDKIRTEFLNSCFIKVLRFENQEVLSDIKNCLEQISKEISPSLSKEGVRGWSNK